MIGLNLLVLSPPMLDTHRAQSILSCWAHGTHSNSVLYHTILHASFTDSFFNLFFFLFSFLGLEHLSLTVYLFEQPSDGKELEFDFSLDDLETIKVIGKGSGGVVQLVRHKWVGRLFALKVVMHKYF